MEAKAFSLHPDYVRRKDYAMMRLLVYMLDDQPIPEDPVPGGD